MQLDTEDAADLETLKRLIDTADTIDDLAAPGAGNLVVLPDWTDPDTITLTHDPEKGLLITSTRFNPVQ